MEGEGPGYGRGFLVGEEVEWQRGWERFALLPWGLFPDRDD